MSTDDIIKKMGLWVSQAKDGEVSELESLLKLNIVIKKASEFKESILPDAINELHHSIEGNSKSYVSNGYRFTPSQKTIYDYSAEPRLKNLKDEIENIQSNMKAACIQAEKGNVFADEDGVIVPPAVKTYGKKSITITKIK